MIDTHNADQVRQLRLREAIWSISNGLTFAAAILSFSIGLPLWIIAFQMLVS